MESLAFRGPVQFVVFLNLLAVLAFVTAWILVIYSIALKRNGSRRTWRKALLVGLFVMVLGSGLVVISSNTKLYNQKEQAEFDKQWDLEPIIDKITGIYNP